MEGGDQRAVSRSGFFPFTTCDMGEQTQIVRLGGQYLSLQTHLTGPNLSFYPGITVDVSSQHATGYMGQRPAMSVVQHKNHNLLKT